MTGYLAGYAHAHRFIQPPGGYYNTRAAISKAIDHIAFNQRWPTWPEVHRGFLDGLLDAMGC